MQPPTGERLLRHVGDRVRFCLRTADGSVLPPGWRVLLRTNLGRGRVMRQNIIASYPARPALAGAEWHDLPLRAQGAEWSGEIMLAEPGFFRAKAYAVDEQGRQHWPAGTDVGLSVHPDAYRTANTIYCAFARLFGETRSLRSTQDEALERQLTKLEKRGYTTLPPSGKLRDVRRQLPHIFDTLGCRILHLLPVSPTPTTYARFGRYGSPYAALDLTGIDPALVEFDQRTTGVDQFCELTRAVQARGGRVFLDVVINHTGWGARLQEEHPEWYVREEGRFVSPGAWGITWDDLVELDHRHPALWLELAEMFLTWCRRGVDGFRCDAGYKVPVRTWRYIVARVQQEFPETIFLLEGLGGSWEITESLLTDGMMQWAYSELFQNYEGRQVAAYLDYALRQCHRVGLYVHYSETHDNNRLASQGRAWSLLRNRLCALASVSGGFGFTGGVEWLAEEKIQVHQCRGLAWGNPENIVPELARLNRLLAEHPCFFDGAVLTRLSPPESPVYALRRESAEGKDVVLVLVNTEGRNARTIMVEANLGRAAGSPPFFVPLLFDLLGQPLPAWKRVVDGQTEVTLPPGAVYCLAPAQTPNGLRGEPYRLARAQAAWGLTALNELGVAEYLGGCEWRHLAELVERDPVRFLAGASALGQERASALEGSVASGGESWQHLEALMGAERYAPVVVWERTDHLRVLPLPPQHWLLLRHPEPFWADLDLQDGRPGLHGHSIQVQLGHVMCFPPQTRPADARLRVRFGAAQTETVETDVRFLAGRPEEAPPPARPAENSLVLLTNGRGGMARLAVDLGRITSKYDCLLGANLHPSLPVDRHILAKRVRIWLVADGFITALEGQNLLAFDPGPPAEWRFVASAGNGRAVEVHLRAEMLPDRNTVRLAFHRPERTPTLGLDLPATCAVSLTVRVDLEDRNFHWETKRTPDAEHHFASGCRPLEGQTGFEFAPAPDRRLRVQASGGRYHPEGEWCQGIPHPVEGTRGMVAAGDAYSPGWFELPIGKGQTVLLLATAEASEPALAHLPTDAASYSESPRTGQPPRDLGARLVLAARAFVVRRDQAKTVIAGYPWFLDWGRDTLIAARGLLAAGWAEEVRQLLEVFGRFEQNGTLPNTIHGEDASNRDTSDAPLWYGVVCEDWVRLSAAKPTEAKGLYGLRVDASGRTLGDVLCSIATHYVRGTPNGIRVDPASGLVWSPSHFTWMDTNYPAGTPREGYPVEIQVLWIQLLRQLAREGLGTKTDPWGELAARAEASFLRHFWLEEQGWLSDVLLGGRDTPAAAAVPDTALRGNGLFAVSFGLLTGERARRCVEAAARYLVVPGALRSLAPLPVHPPLPIHAPDGRLLNNPTEPYCGRYEGIEDTQRKPAYHNGTAWTWTFPTFCEALARAWDFSPEAVAAARAYLGSTARLLEGGCLGQLPEIMDGDAPHQPRGCDAQAWSATEALRVWQLLKNPPRPRDG